MTLVTSLMKPKNNSGPRLDIWGTPDVEQNILSRNGYMIHIAWLKLN